MKLSKFVIMICIVVLTTNSYKLQAQTNGLSAESVLDQWFSIDPQHDIEMQQTTLPADALGKRFNLSFISDDQQRVNGTLAMPEIKDGKLKLALMLHPMGRDENIWWSEDNALSGGAISTRLRQQGYAVLSLDARRHGKRTLSDMGLGELLKRAHGKHPRQYTDMIVGTVRDYRLALHWLKNTLDLSDTSIFAIGYSMGAQMSLLLASYESDINQLLVMVPPYVQQKNSPVAPRYHVAKINQAQLMMFVAKQDPYSSEVENQEVFDKVSTKNKNIKWFDSGHLLPKAYLQMALGFIDQLPSTSLSLEK